MELAATKQALFNNFEFREILLTFLYKTIKGEYKNPQHLKRVINKAYTLNGITQNQKDGLLMSLELERQAKGSKYKREELLALINNLYYENYITSLDYVIALTLGASKEVFSPRVIANELEKQKIDIKSFNEDIEAIIKDLENL